MRIHVGDIAALTRYPVKSMRGEPLDAAALGWHGLAGDRRLALRRIGDRGGFPWLTASKLPELVAFEPRGHAGDLPSHVRTPDGRELELFGDELVAEIERRSGVPVEMTHFDRGIFDEASVSLITATTVDTTCALAGLPHDARRFRPNIVLALRTPEPYVEDTWVGGVLTFGDAQDAPAIAITNRDLRCSMVNIDPDTARVSPEVLKAIVRERDTNLGVYATVMRRGRLAVGQAVYLEVAHGSA